MIEQFQKLKFYQVTMLKERGYDTQEEDWILDEHLSPTEFKNRLLKNRELSEFRTVMNSRYDHLDPNKKGIYVNYVSLSLKAKQIKVDLIRYFVSILIEENRDGILIVNANLSIKAAEGLSYVTSSKYQIFIEDELKHCVINHYIVPQQELIPEDQVVILKKELGCNNRSLSNMSVDDPVAKYWNWPVNSWVKIYQDIEIGLTSNWQIEYRVIVGK